MPHEAFSHIIIIITVLMFTVFALLVTNNDHRNKSDEKEIDKTSCWNSRTDPSVMDSIQNFLFNTLPTGTGR